MTRAHRGSSRRVADRVWLPIVAACILAACTGAPVYEQRVHVVRAGDTLYKIAWQYRVDQRDLARWNSLRNPDLIYVGQRLRLGPPSAAVRAPQPVANRTPTPASAPAPRSSPPPAPASTRPPPRAQPSPQPAPQPAPTWQWPTDGEIVSRFGSSASIATGIGIGGRAGQTVRAAAAGRIVYTGSGLIGYGQLVIIKHNDTYLSAYGYNSQVLVTQGQDVRRGEPIATMGLGPERQPRLHFEIRRDGVPVDPLPLLSARR